MNLSQKPSITTLCEEENCPSPTLPSFHHDSCLCVCLPRAAGIWFSHCFQHLGWHLAVCGHSNVCSEKVERKRGDHVLPHWGKKHRRVNCEQGQGLGPERVPDRRLPSSVGRPQASPHFF